MVQAHEGGAARGNGPALENSVLENSVLENGAVGNSAAQGGVAVVGIGASAGGLEACTKLVKALPSDTGMAFVLVQHLAPAHASMMVELLAAHTDMTVLQATEDMPVEPDHLYVIPPGALLAIAGGALHLSPLPMRAGAHLPFDFLLRSLAAECGARAACVILSGTGTDGSLGLAAIKAQGGLVIAQDPAEADHDGMPRSAVATGAVDQVLPVAGIPAALAEHFHDLALLPPAAPPPAAPSPAARADVAPPHAAPSGVAPPGAASPGAASEDQLADIIALLQATTPYDFTLYKTGTLERRIERRVGMEPPGAGGVTGYLARLTADAGERELLAKDLLINVTRFFRDPTVFTLLEAEVLPELIRNAEGQQLRVWVIGCSTGEESYSLAMLFREAIAAAAQPIKLQVFASDVDPDAVTAAREGFYPSTIEEDVTPERLARFFAKEEHGYRVLPDLRAAVVFHRAGRAHRPAVLPPGLGVLPQPADLPAA